MTQGIGDLSIPCAHLFIVLRRWSYFTPTSFTSSTRQPILLAVALE